MRQEFPTELRHVDATETRRVGLESAMRLELGAVLADTAFQRSPVLSRLLRFLVEETLAGRGDALKAYAVAVDGLGRPADFDTRSDSYPRVQMVRLRKMLDSHYAHNNPVGDLCLSLQTGSYRVRLATPALAYPNFFRPAAAPQPLVEPSEAITDVASEAGVLSPGPLPSRRYKGQLIAAILLVLAVVIVCAVINMPRAPRAGPVLAVAPPATPQSPILRITPVAVGADPSSAMIARAAQATLIDGLSRSWINQVRVVERNASPADSGPTRHAFQLDSELVNSPNGTPSLFLRLSDAHSATMIWSASVRLSGSSAEVDTAMAPVIAQISGVFGVIATHETRALSGRFDPGYACLLAYIASQKTHDPRLQARIARCMQMPVEEARLIPPMLAARAFFTLETKTPKMERQAAVLLAQDFADQAVQADPKDAYAQFAAARIAFVAGDCASGKHHTDLAIAANPYDPILLSVLAGLLYQCGDPAAQPLLDRAFLFKSDGLSFARLTFILAAISQGRSDHIASLANVGEEAKETNLPYYYLCETLIEAAQDHDRAAAAHWAQFLAAYPGAKTSNDVMLQGFILSDTLRADTLAYLAKKHVIAGGG